MYIKRDNRMNKNIKQTARPILSNPPKNGFTIVKSLRYVKLAAIKPTASPTKDPNDFINPSQKQRQAKATTIKTRTMSNQFII